MTKPAFTSSPPTCAQAATIAVEASEYPEWGMFVWLALTSGVPHDELCALRWADIDFDAGVLVVRSGIAETGGLDMNTDAETREPRRVTLDPNTITLLHAYLSHCAAHAAINGIERHSDPYMFSPDPDGAAAPEPDAAAQRYMHMCARLGWEMHLHQLRQYSAAELIEAGVDMLAFSWRLQRGLSRIQRRPRR